jgi:hypothetical protein
MDIKQEHGMATWCGVYGCAKHGDWMNGWMNIKTACEEQTEAQQKESVTPLPPCPRSSLGFAEIASSDRKRERRIVEGMQHGTHG